MSDLVRRKLNASSGRGVEPDATAVLCDVNAGEVQPKVVGRADHHGAVFSVSDTTPRRGRGPCSLEELWSADDPTFLEIACSLAGKHIDPAQLGRSTARLRSGEPRTLVFLELVGAGAAADGRALRRKLRLGGFFLSSRLSWPQSVWDVVNAIGRWHIAESGSAESNDAFISRAYRSVLGRVEDEAGKAHFLRALGAGSTRLEVLLALHASDEGRSKGRRVSGLNSLELFTNWSRLPVVRHLLGLARLPAFVNASSRKLRRIDAVLTGITEAQSHSLDVTMSALSEHRAEFVGARKDASRVLGGLEELRTVIANVSDSLRSLSGDLERFRGEERAANRELRQEVADVSDRLRSLSGDLEHFRGEERAASKDLRWEIAEARSSIGLLGSSYDWLRAKIDATENSLGERISDLNSALVRELAADIGALRLLNSAVSEKAAQHEALLRLIQVELGERDAKHALALATLDGRVGLLGERADMSDVLLEGLRPQLDRVETYSLASASRFAVPCGERSVLVRTVNGYVMCPQEDVALVSTLVEGAPYEPGTNWVISNGLTKGSMFLDVGANVGIHTLAAARVVGQDGRVLAFEPHPHTAACLEKTVWMNGLTGFVSVRAIALSDVQGSAKMYLGKTSGHHSMLPLGAPFDASELSPFEVTLRRLDDVVPHEGVPALIKIDVEGLELKVLAGAHALLSRCRHIGLVVELGQSHLQRSDVDLSSWLARFSLLGFKAMIIDDSSCSLKKFTLEEIASLPSVNMFFARPGSHLWSRLGGSL